jgi:hypothetical protein
MSCRTLAGVLAGWLLIGTNGCSSADESVDAPGNGGADAGGSGGAAQAGSTDKSGASGGGASGGGASGSGASGGGASGGGASGDGAGGGGASGSGGMGGSNTGGTSSEPPSCGNTACLPTQYCMVVTGGLPESGTSYSCMPLGDCRDCSCLNNGACICSVSGNAIKQLCFAP